MIHPDWYQDESGIVLVKANPPFIARNEYIRRQKNRDAKPFRLRNVYTDCFLTAEPGVADEVYVVLEPATGRRGHLSHCASGLPASDASSARE
ncbi:unnamed protein product [Vitrella brassicaformis CCMP3155]|uniref:Uncharacterized protein n=1 Tax=Vitrella brassicaformis (strain CCMP3155) TaxID=1169540 RepID=A0A0G4EK65_VITBC|nr:unnamed protein product [Vitrella brassicaformis CCMP3155]|eukprot:CEL96917.1 unnamed protein product [Vitrella brassicaformis CCMP3155]